MAIAARVPVPSQVFTQADYVTFDNALVKFGMETSPANYIRTGWELKCRRVTVRQLMERLCKEPPKDTWDFDSVPKECNVQAYLATEAFVDRCAAKGSFDDSMLAKLVGNLKLLTMT